METEEEEELDEPTDIACQLRSKNIFLPELILMKQKTFLISISLFFFLTGNGLVLMGQTEGSIFKKSTYKNKITLFTGYHFSKSQDLIFSDMIYKGHSGSTIGLEYERITRKGIHWIRGAFDKANVESTKLISFEGFEGTQSRQASDALQANISYGYGRLLTSSEAFRFYLGGMLETKVHLTNYQFGLSENDGYLIANSVNAWLRTEYQLDEKNSVQAALYFPLLSWIGRSEYSIVDNEEIQYEGSDFGFIYKKAELNSWSSYKAWNMAFSFSHTFSPALGFNIRYQLDYLRHTDPLAISVLKNHFDLGFSLKL